MAQKHSILVLLCSLLTWKHVSSLQFIVGSEDQMRWALESVSAGDEILIANRTVPINESLSTTSGGQWNSPIRMYGIGSASALQETGTGNLFDLIQVEHSNWIFESFSMTGTYYNGFYIANPSFQNITIQNMNFREGRLASGTGIETYGQNILIQQNTFNCQSAAVYVYNLDPEVETTLVIKNNTIYTEREGASMAVYLKGVRSAFLENNVFSIQNFGVWQYFVVASDSKVMFAGNVGNRATLTGFSVWLNEDTIPLDKQGYAFVRNHCDIGNVNVWCMDIANNELFNVTAITLDNTFENARGLTNMPL